MCHPRPARKCVDEGRCSSRGCCLASTPCGRTAAAPRFMASLCRGPARGFVRLLYEAIRGARASLRLRLRRIGSRRGTAIERCRRHDRRVVRRGRARGARRARRCARRVGVDVRRDWRSAVHRHLRCRVVARGGSRGRERRKCEERRARGSPDRCGGRLNRARPTKWAGLVRAHVSIARSARCEGSHGVSLA